MGLLPAKTLASKEYIQPFLHVQVVRALFRDVVKMPAILPLLGLKNF